MARPLRIERPGAWYHLTVRGVERRAIFRDDRDRRRWLELVAEAVERFRWIAHAYVLMDNHYHLIVELTEPNLSRGMQWFQTSYSMGFNRRHGRVGPLVQGRFKALLVDPVGWGLAVSRYVHLNPVRTARLGLDKSARGADRLGLGDRPDTEQVRQRVHRLRTYRWSSYRAYVGLAAVPPWLTRQAVLELGGRGRAHEQQAAYGRYVEEAIRQGLKASPWEHLEARLILGTKRLVEDLRHKFDGAAREQPQGRWLKRRPSWEAVVKAVERVRGEQWSEFRDRYGDWGRELAWHLGRRQGAFSLRELGVAAGGVDYAAVSAALQRFERRLARDDGLRAAAERASRLLNVET